MVFFMRGCGKGLDHTGFKIYDFLFDKTQTVFCQQRSISCLLIVAQRKHIFPIFICYFAYENNCCHFRVFYFFYCSLIQCGGKKFACTQCSTAKDTESYFQEKYQLFFKLFVFGGSDLRLSTDFLPKNVDVDKNIQDTSGFYRTSVQYTNKTGVFWCSTSWKYH